MYGKKHNRICWSKSAGQAFESVQQSNTRTKVKERSGAETSEIYRRMKKMCKFSLPGKERYNFHLFEAMHVKLNALSVNS